MFDSRKIAAYNRARQAILTCRPEDRPALREALYSTWQELRNPLFDEAWRRLREGDGSMADVAVQFLEEDPYFASTGYWKQYVIKSLRALDLPEDLVKRLRDVCLTVVDKGDRREFREYCRLAALIADESMIEELIARRSSLKKGVARRSEWMLRYVNLSRRGKLPGEVSPGNVD